MNRKLDDLGRLVIPAEMRNKLSLKSGDSVNIELVGKKVIVTNPNEIDYKQILDEIREIVENSEWRLDDVRDLIDGYNEILQILDKAKQ